MKQKLVAITREQEACLLELMKADGNSMSAHIRSAIDLYLRSRPDPRLDYSRPTER